MEFNLQNTQLVQHTLTFHDLIYKTALYAVKLENSTSIKANMGHTHLSLFSSFNIFNPLISIDKKESH